VKRFPKDLVINLFILILSIFLLIIVSNYPTMARSFPQLVLILVVILSLADMVYKSLRGDKMEISQGKDEQKREERRVFYTVFLMFGYMVFILLLGFILGTLLFLIFSTWSLGYKKIKGLVISSLCSAGLMYIIFILIMKSFLPESLLFSLLRR